MLGPLVDQAAIEGRLDSVALLKEDAVLLRSGALLIINELDEVLGRYHAVRL